MVELHCHLDGVADPAMLREIAADGVALAVGASELEAMLPVHDMDSFIAWFSVADALEGSLVGYQPILHKQVERWCKQGVRHAELMVGTSELPDDVVEMDRFRRWLTAIEDERIEVELLLAINRARSRDSVEALFDRAAPFFDGGYLAGIAIAGWPEQGQAVASWAPAISELKRRGVGIEIHAGEWAGPESVRDAIAAGADRIGHGVTAFQDDKLVDEIIERGIHIEMCPTSNLKTGSIASIDQHPIARAFERGVSLSINSDDPGAFECSIASEHALVRRHFGLDDDAFAWIAKQSFDARFGRRTRTARP